MGHSHNMFKCDMSCTV